VNTASTQERWVNPTIYTGVGIVAVYCVGVSGYWLVKLAAFCSMHDVLGFSVPVSLDVAGGIAAIVWVKGSTKEARMWGAGIAVSTLIGSLGGNILAHLIEAGIVKVTPWLIIGVGSIPPIMLFLTIHLLIVFSNRPAPVSRRVKPAVPVAASEPSRGARPPAAARETTASAVSTSPAADASRAAADSAPLIPETAAATPASNVREIHPGQLPLKALGKAWFLKQVAEGRDLGAISAAEVDAAIGASTGYCKKLIKGWRDEVASQTTAVNQ
jgi:hypothetical protein